MDLSSALDVLQSASDDLLRSHAAKTILTLRQIGERLQVNLLRTVDDKASSASSSSLVTDERNIEPNIERLPSVYESHHDDVAQAPERAVPYHRTDEVVCPLPGDLPATQKSPTRKNHQPAKDVVSKLSSAMKRTVPWIWRISKKDQKVIKSYKRKTSEDRRLEDIRRVEGDPKPSELDKLFRLLAIRSLALDFTAEQMRENLQTKVDQLFDYVCSIDAEKDIQRKTTGRQSDVSAFVRRHPEIRVSKELANRAINNGIKHLVFEKALATKLQKQEMPHQSAVVSGILGQSINDFKNLTYRRMPDLLDDLLSDKSKLSLPDDTGSEKEQSMMSVIKNTNDWFERLQAKYNDSRSGTIIPHCEGPNAKRARHNRSNCASQRSSSQPEHSTTPSEYSPSRSEYLPTRSENGEPLAANDTTAGDTGSAAQNATGDDSIYDAAPPLGLSELETEPAYNDRSSESPREEGYDPFDVDFDFLIQELDDQMSRAAKDPLVCGEQAGHRPSGYDPFEEDFTFILCEVDDQSGSIDKMQSRYSKQNDQNTDLFEGDRTDGDPFDVPQIARTIPTN